MVSLFGRGCPEPGGPGPPPGSKNGSNSSNQHDKMNMTQQNGRYSPSTLTTTHKVTSNAKANDVSRECTRNKGEKPLQHASPLALITPKFEMSTANLFTRASNTDYIKAPSKGISQKRAKVTFTRPCIGKIQKIDAFLGTTREEDYLKSLKQRKAKVKLVINTSRIKVTKCFNLITDKFGHEHKPVEFTNMDREVTRKNANIPESEELNSNDKVYSMAIEEEKQASLQQCAIFFQELMNYIWKHDQIDSQQKENTQNMDQIAYSLVLFQTKDYQCAQPFAFKCKTQNDQNESNFIQTNQLEPTNEPNEKLRNTKMLITNENCGPTETNEILINEKDEPRKELHLVWKNQDIASYNQTKQGEPAQASNDKLRKNTNMLITDENCDKNERSELNETERNESRKDIQFCWKNQGEQYVNLKQELNKLEQVKTESGSQQEVKHSSNSKFGTHEPHDQKKVNVKQKVAAGHNDWKMTQSEVKRTKGFKDRVGKTNAKLQSTGTSITNEYCGTNATKELNENEKLEIQQEFRLLWITLDVKCYGHNNALSRPKPPNDQTNEEAKSKQLLGKVIQLHLSREPYEILNQETQATNCRGLWRFSTSNAISRCTKNEQLLIIIPNESQDQLTSELLNQIPCYVRPAAMNSCEPSLFSKNWIRNTSNNTNGRTNAPKVMSLGQTQKGIETNLHDKNHLPDWITVEYCLICTIGRSSLSINLIPRIHFANSNLPFVNTMFTGLTITKNLQHAMCQRYQSRSENHEYFSERSRNARMNGNEYEGTFLYGQIRQSDQYAVLLNNALQLGQCQAKHRYVPYDRGKLFVQCFLCDFLYVNSLYVIFCM